MPKRGGLGRGLDALIPAKKSEKTQKKKKTEDNALPQARGIAASAAKKASETQVKAEKRTMVEKQTDASGSAASVKKKPSANKNAVKKSASAYKAAGAKQDDSISAEVRRRAEEIISGGGHDFSVIEEEEIATDANTKTASSKNGFTADSKAGNTEIEAENTESDESTAFRTKNPASKVKNASVEKQSADAEIKGTAAGADKNTPNRVGNRKTVQQRKVSASEKAMETNVSEGAERAEQSSVSETIHTTADIEGTETASKAQSFEPEASDKNIVSMRISLVEPNRGQPRKYFDDEAIKELADSIRQFGILSPLLVQKKQGYYEIIAGERRWRAAKKAGLKEVPVIVRDFSGQEAVEVSLIENIQREDLNPIEEAKAYDRLVSEYGLNQEEVAGRVSKSRSAVANSMRLLKLADEIQKMVETGELSEGHARTLIPLIAPELQKGVADQIIKEKLSVRQTEKIVRDLLQPGGKKEKKTDERRDALLASLSENLKSALGTKVSIRQSGKNKGRIEIEYYSDDELDRIYELLRSVR